MDPKRSLDHEKEGNILSKEEALIQRLLEHDEYALKDLMELYQPRLLRQAMGFLGNLQDAEECVNDTFLKVWNSVPPYRPKNLLLYLLRVCRFTAFDMIDKREALKRNAILVELTQELMETIPQKTRNEETKDELFSEYLNDFLDSIPKEKRIIFVKRYWYEESIDSIASEMKLSQSKVKTTLSRLRKALKKVLEQKGYRRE